jgi:hypothetical protein
MFSRAVATWKHLVGWRRKKPTAGEERRIWARHSVSLATTYQPAHDPAAERMSVRVHDVSRGGISLVVDQAFEPGELLSVELPTSPGAPTATVLACVVRSRCRPDGAWVLGCTFAAQLQDQDLQLFGAVRARPDDPDQRDWVRFDCKVEAFYRAVNVPTSTVAPATIVNVSACGIALEVDQPLEIGELISIDLRAGEHFLFSTLACVVRVTTAAEGGRSLLGCNFIGELADAQLQSLLH